MKHRHFIIYGILLVALALPACRKLVEVGSPVNQLTADKIYTDSASTSALLTNIYSLLNKNIDGTYTTSLGMYADELGYTGSDAGTLEFLQSSLATANAANLNIWANSYGAIYQCNDLIQGMSAFQGISPAAKSRFTCEAKFLRAYLYFYLTGTYGPVPLVLVTDVNRTSGAARADSAGVYGQIEKDLTEAMAGLPDTYPVTGRTRANKWAAAALLARVYLYERKYAQAEAMATTVIGSGLYTPLESPANVFLAGSTEAILQVFTQYGYTAEGTLLVPNGGMPIFPISPGLYQAFEAGDLRRSYWTDSTTVDNGTTPSTYYFPHKYHNNASSAGGPEYLVLLRAGEQYLIRAEARLFENNIAGAVADLNVIRGRAGLTLLQESLSADSCLNALLQERRVELFCEWGHRFLDLKRTGRADAVLGAVKSSWQPFKVLLPIPQSELSSDPHLSQNPGY